MRLSVYVLVVVASLIIPITSSVADDQEKLQMPREKTFLDEFWDGVKRGNGREIAPVERSKVPGPRVNRDGRWEEPSRESPEPSEVNPILNLFGYGGRSGSEDRNSEGRWIEREEWVGPNGVNEDPIKDNILNNRVFSGPNRRDTESGRWIDESPRVEKRDTPSPRQADQERSPRSDEAEVAQGNEKLEAVREYEKALNAISGRQASLTGRVNALVRESADLKSLRQRLEAKMANIKRIKAYDSRNEWEVEPPWSDFLQAITDEKTIQSQIAKYNQAARVFDQRASQLNADQERLRSDREKLQRSYHR